MINPACWTAGHAPNDRAAPSGLAFKKPRQTKSKDEGHALHRMAEAETRARPRRRPYASAAQTRNLPSHACASSFGDPRSSRTLRSTAMLAFQSSGRRRCAAMLHPSNSRMKFLTVSRSASPRLPKTLSSPRMARCAKRPRTAWSPRPWPSAGRKAPPAKPDNRARKSQYIRTKRWRSSVGSWDSSTNASGRMLWISAAWAPGSPKKANQVIRGKTKKSSASQSSHIAASSGSASRTCLTLPTILLKARPRALSK
mmetsp:Transcript_5655/g.15928  ORF Transcript_5655/g.15928 Transcript_5655/m.15928 type:complete len:255 (-) Transcript_5655:1069-1833(-)